MLVTRVGRYDHQMRIIGDVRILDCNGKIKLGEGTMAIRNAIRDALDSGTKKVVLNLAEVTYIDSAGIGELMRTYTSVMEAEAG